MRLCLQQNLAESARRELYCFSLVLLRYASTATSLPVLLVWNVVYWELSSSGGISFVTWFKL